MASPNPASERVGGPPGSRLVPLKSARFATIDEEMGRHLFVSAALAAFTLQSQAPPPMTPPTSPFAGALIKRPGEGAPVAFTFAWPAGMTATIDAERTKTTITPDGRKTQSGGLRYRMRVSAHKQGRLISYDSFEPIGVSMSSAEQSAVDQMLNSLMPSIVIDDTGEFVRVGDLAPIRATLRKMLDELKKQAPGGAIPPNIQAVLDSLASDKVLTQAAAAEWYSMVGAYVGYSGTVGTMKEFTTEEPLPVMPGVMVPMRTTFGAKQHAPCQNRMPVDSCVVMQLKSVVAPGVMEGILRKLLEGVKGMDGLRYEAMDVVTDVQTTIDPATLRPHLVTRTKTVEFIMSAPGMGRANASMVEKKTYKITYHVEPVR